MLEYIRTVQDVLKDLGKSSVLSNKEYLFIEEAFKRGNSENGCANLIIEMRNGRKR